jgi:hypothetical protein
MPHDSWRLQFPELPHEPQDLDLVRRHLAWTPSERLQNLKRANAFVERARKAPFRAAAGKRMAPER